MRSEYEEVVREARKRGAASARCGAAAWSGQPELPGHQKVEQRVPNPAGRLRRSRLPTTRKPRLDPVSNGRATVVLPACVASADQARCELQAAIAASGTIRLAGLQKGDQGAVPLLLELVFHGQPPGRLDTIVLAQVWFRQCCASTCLCMWSCTASSSVLRQ